MDFDSPKWSDLAAGYRIPYDPRKALRALELGDSKAWDELWNELHHQGDVGEASYAAVPHLVRIYIASSRPDSNIYGLVAIIDDARRYGQNPKLPADFQMDYELAWRQLAERGLRELSEAQDETLIVSILAVLAIWKRQFALGHLAMYSTDDELAELLKRNGVS